MVDLLAKKDYSTRQLTEKLRTKGYSSEETEAAIDKALEWGYLGDLRVAKNIWRFNYEGHQYSVSRILQKLREKGFTAEIISEKGAVSSECVAKMAEGVRRLTGSTFSIATSGIAGPGGGSEEKPVGLVWVGVATPLGVSTVKFNFKGDRKRNMERFASSALDTLRKAIESYLNR